MTAMLEETIAHIESQGYEVRTSHFRRWTMPEVLATRYGIAEVGIPSPTLEPHGGETHVYILDELGDLIVRSVAVASNRDSYCKRKGRLKATMRAAHALSRIQNGEAVAIEVTPYATTCFDEPLKRNMRSVH